MVVEPRIPCLQAWGVSIYHTPARKVAEKGEKYGDDTHPQARKNMVILV